LGSSSDKNNLNNSHLSCNESSTKNSISKILRNNTNSNIINNNYSLLAKRNSNNSNNSVSKNNNCNDLQTPTVQFFDNTYSQNSSNLNNKQFNNRSVHINSIKRNEISLFPISEDEEIHSTDDRNYL
jgi:hypothetical protein